MLFRALGEMAVVGDDGEVARIAAGKQRALFALLLIDANSVVSRSALISGIWGESLPASPESALHVVMSRLRGNLGAHGRRISVEHGGYRLDAAPDEVDILSAESLLRDGRSALASGDPSAGAEAFERALTLWTGDALHDLRDYPFWEVAARRLADLRIALVEARNDAYLMSGRHLEVVSDAEAWIAAEPLREHLRAQYVVALYRAGRQAEALRACEELRKALRDDLGLDPSPEMQELERRVLDQDRTLGAAESGFLTPLPEWTAEVLPFVDRVEELERVRSAFSDVSKGSMRLVVVTGEAGIGKSRFLLHVARNLARDAIVIPLHVNHLWESTLHALARALSEATVAISDEDLRFILRDLPDHPQDVPFVKATARALLAGENLEELLDDAALLRGAARWIAALSAKAPVALIIDDFDTAGTPLNHIVAKLAMLSMPKRVLVVAGARGPLDRTAPQVAQLLAAASERGVAESFELTAFSTEDIDALLARMHVDPRRTVVERLAQLTGGHPLLLAEMLSRGPAERIVEDWSCPPRIADVVRRRTAELGQATADVLRAASLFESDFSVGLLAEVMGANEGTVAQLVDRALDAHVLQPTTATSYRFTHRTYRQTLIGDLSEERRANGHRRIATVLERCGNAPAAVIAAHWAGAHGDDADAKVAAYSRAAAREAMALSEPHSAVYWLDIASPFVDEAERGRFLVELAEAQQLAGDPRGVESLCQAVRLALDADDDSLTLRILDARLPAWSILPGVTGEDTQRLLSRALQSVGDDVTRSRVEAWLGADVVLHDPPGGIRLIESALALARKSGDQQAIAESLMRFSAAAGAPHDLARRRATILELLEVVGPFDVASRYFAWSTLALAAIQQGNVDEADEALSHADTVASQYDLGPVRWSQRVRRAWRAALAGDVERAEQQICAAAEYGVQTGITAATDTATLQSVLLDWQQGRLGARAERMRENLRRADEAFPAIVLVLARALAEHEHDRDESRAIVETFARDRFARVRTGPFWSSLLIAAAETAAMTRLPEASAMIRDLLQPFDDQVAHPGMWVTGPIAYGIGVACLGCGDQRAQLYLDRAVDMAKRLRAPLLVEQARAATALVG